jgi:hypothetical protein
MHRLFAQMAAALNATNEIRALAKFRLPLAINTPSGQRYGPALLFGLGPVYDMDRQPLSELVQRALPDRFAETGAAARPSKSSEPGLYFVGLPFLTRFASASSRRIAAIRSIRTTAAAYLRSVELDPQSLFRRRG